MSKYGFIEVFQRVPSTSRSRESTVFVLNFHIVYISFSFSADGEQVQWSRERGRRDYLPDSSVCVDSARTSLCSANN